MQNRLLRLSFRIVFGHEISRGLRFLAVKDTGRHSSTVPEGGRPGAIRYPANLGRFVVLGELGRGASGVVLAAHDPALRRKVAVKLLSRGQASAVARVRLIREAQAMAMLSHPNVLTVHEIGTSEDDQVYIAMEYAERGTLRDWLEAGPRAWPEIVDAFVQAGRGLAAAHSAGLVHRDFKPANVVVGSDGRMRVSDFGLVSAGRREVTAEEETDQFGVLTKTDQVVGTPLYMAPEQHGIGDVDARADQFAFCVALHEALYGEPPFEGATYWELLTNVCGGRVREPSRPGAVPARIRAAIRRGLSLAAQDRFPSMDALLAELEVKPPRSWRIAFGVAAAVIVIGGVVSIVSIRGAGVGAVCPSPADKLAGVWDAEVQAAVRDSFLRSGRPHAVTTFALSQTRIDSYAREWIAMRSDVCEATHVRHEQSEPMLDRRNLCLDHKLQELRALTRAFTHVREPAMVDGALVAIANLSPVSECADIDQLVAEKPLPRQPITRAAVVAASIGLAEATTLRHVGQFDRANELIDGALAVARAAKYPPLEADALYLRGDVAVRAEDPKRAEQALGEAMQAASVAGDDSLVAECAIYLVKVIGVLGSRPDEAMSMLQFAESAVLRAGNTEFLQGWLHDARGVLFWAKGEYETAAAELGQATRLLDGAQGAPRHMVATTFHNLALMLRNTGDDEAAIVAEMKALALFTTTLGGHHPQVATTRMGLGTSFRRLGRLREAREQYTDALVITTASLGWNHSTAADAIVGLGNVARLAGDFDEAIRQHRRAAELYGRLEGRTNRRMMALAISNEATALRARGDVAMAEDRARRALAMFTEARGPDHPDTALAHYELGACLHARGALAEARTHLEKALAIWERAHGREHFHVTDALTELGTVLLDEGTRELALPMLERAVSASVKDASEPDLVADAQFGLSRALWSRERDRARALELADQARLGYERAGRNGIRGLAALEKWSKAHHRAADHM